MRATANKKLNLLDAEDFVNREVLNENTEKIDEVLKTLEEPEHDTTKQTEVEELESGESLKVALRKLAKAVADYISHKADKVAHITAEERTAWNAKLGAEKIAANLTTTEAGMLLDATMGKKLQDQVTTNANSISTLNSNLRSNIGKIQTEATRDITLTKGIYLLTFYQGGMWPRNGLAYFDFTGYTEGSHFKWICGNLSTMLTVTITSSGLTITATSDLGVTINVGSTKLKTY